MKHYFEKQIFQRNAPHHVELYNWMKQLEKFNSKKKNKVKGVIPEETVKHKGQK